RRCQSIYYKSFSWTYPSRARQKHGYVRQGAVSQCKLYRCFSAYMAPLVHAIEVVLRQYVPVAYNKYEAVPHLLELTPRHDSATHRWISDQHPTVGNTLYHHKVVITLDVDQDY